MKAIVTGSKGFIGKAVCAALRKRGWELTEYDLQDGINLVTTEVEFPKVDAIFHLAATNGTRLFYEKPAHVLKNNTLLTFCFDRYMNEHPETKFIFASTCELFNGAVDNFGWEVPTAENVPAVFFDLANPRWSYSLPKALGENYFRSCYKNATVIRYFNIFGEGQKDHFVGEFIERCIKSKEYKIYGDDTRSFCYVEDAAEMTVNMLDAGNEVYNIGRAEEVSISTVAHQIMKILGLQSERLEVLPPPVGSVKRRCPNVIKYNKKFGQYEYTPLEVSLSKTVEWYVKQMEI